MNNQYVQIHVDSHHKTDRAYRITYLDNSLADALFDKPYRALITGCGTLGQSQLMQHAESVTGLDIEPKMIEAGRHLTRPSKFPVIFIQKDLRDFPRSLPVKMFDFIELGLQGSSLPVDPQLMSKYFTLLKPGGVMLVKCSVMGAEDILGRGGKTYWSIFRAIYDFFSWNSIPVTVTKTNQKINKFLSNHCNAKVLMKSVSKKLNWPVTTYDLWIEKV